MTYRLLRTLKFSFFIFIFTLAIVQIPAHAIYKCNENGAITYSDIPCKSSATQQTLTQSVIPPSDINTAQKNHKNNQQKLKTLQLQQKQEAEAQRKQDAIAEKKYQKKQQANKKRLTQCKQLDIQVKLATNKRIHSPHDQIEKNQLKEQQAVNAYNAVCI